MAVETAAQGNVLPGDIAQARIDLETARDAVHTAVSAERTAQIKLSSARNLARQDTAVNLALMNGGVTALQVLPGSANLFGGRSVTLKNVRPAR